MIFVLDYDQTFTATPDLWTAFIHAAHAQGHEVVCCTLRHEQHEGDEVKERLGHLVKRIVFTGRKRKHAALAALGIVANVWIDDQPTWIFNDLI